jgi:hypothetical protein
MANGAGLAFASTRRNKRGVVKNGRMGGLDAFPANFPYIGGIGEFAKVMSNPSNASTKFEQEKLVRVRDVKFSTKGAGLA